MKRMASLLDHYLQEMAESIVKVEKSEETFRAVVAGYEHAHGPGVVADYKAADDVRLRTAVGDGAFYRSRASMYASAATALMLDSQRRADSGTTAIRPALRDRRVAAGMSQARLAQAMGTVQSAVSELESGTSEPTLPTLTKWAGALGFDVQIIDRPVVV